MSLVSHVWSRQVLHPLSLRGGGGAEAIQEANSGLTRHCWKQQILADIKLTVSKLTRFHSTGSFYKPRDQINTLPWFSCLCCWMWIWLDLTWFGTCCCWWTQDSGWLHLYPCWLRQRHLAEPLLRLRAVPHHPRHGEAAQTREVSWHRPHSRQNLLTGIIILDSS